jgi:hypothetical protein
MRELEVPAFEALRRTRRFRRHDERAMREMSGVQRDRKNYIHLVRQQSEELERLLCADRDDPEVFVDAAWDTDGLRGDVGLTSKPDLDSDSPR